MTWLALVLGNLAAAYGLALGVLDALAPEPKEAAPPPPVPDNRKVVSLDEARRRRIRNAA